MTLLPTPYIVEPNGVNAPGVQGNFDALATEALRVQSMFAVVSTMPTIGVDNQQLYFQNTAMATLGIVWGFRYRAASASTYKWEFTGGAPIHSQVDADESIVAATTTYAALATAGPTVVAPLRGEYLVSFGLRGYPFAFAQTLYMAYDISGIPYAAFDNDAVLLDCAAGFGQTASRTRSATTTAAGQTFTAKYRHSNPADQATFKNRWMNLTPIRVVG